MRRYLHDVLATLSICLNTVRGGDRYEPLCSAIWRNIKDGGFWSRVWLPAWFVRHCKWSSETK